MDLDQMQQWMVTLGPSSYEPLEPIEYHESTTESLAERCAGAAAEWGSEKTAGVLEPALLYKDPDAHPLVLSLLVLDRYGGDSLDWSPEVLRVTMMRDNLQVSGVSFAKIMAVRVLLQSPSPWRQWHVFHWISRALAGLPPNFVYLEQPELGHLLVCADVMAIVDPKRQTAVEVDKFIAAALRHEGFVWAPESLSFAERQLEEPQLECGKCQALFTDDNDTHCVTCGATSLRRVPYAYAALRDECLRLWQPRRTMPLERAVEGLPDSPAGNLVYTLAVHWDYATRIRKQLLGQMRGLAR
jgi:hypothetical protein